MSVIDEVETVPDHSSCQELFQALRDEIQTEREKRIALEELVHSLRSQLESILSMPVNVETEASSCEVPIIERTTYKPSRSKSVPKSTNRSFKSSVIPDSVLSIITKK